MTRKPDEPGMAAMVRVHVMHGERPILGAARTAGDDPQDSGWIFSCGIEPHPDSEWKIVEVDWCFRADDTLDALLGMPWEHQAARDGPGEAWRVMPIEGD